jgi:hypothetical protein
VSLPSRLKNAARFSLYNTLGRSTLRGRDPKPDIVILSSRRSGSTWLSELLYHQPRTRRVLEPYDTTLNHPHYSGALPPAHRGFFVDPSAEERNMLMRFFRDLRSGRKQIRTNWKIWNEEHSFIHDRTVFKLFYAKDMLDAFAREPDVEIIYLVRHPVPVALSHIRLQWPCSLDSYWLHPSFRHVHLSAHQRSVIARIHSSGTDLERYAAGWFLENLLATRQAATQPVLTLRYEDIVARPAELVSQLRTKIGLADPERLRARIRTPSFNTMGREAAIRTAPTRASLAWTEHPALREAPLVDPLFRAFEDPNYSNPYDLTSKTEHAA